MRISNLTECPICRNPITYTVDEILSLSSSLVHKQLIDTYRNHRINYKNKSPKKTLKLKISLLGSSGSGKSTIMRYLAGFPFIDDVSTTVGVDTVVIDVEIKDYLVKVYLWDTAGQEIFRTIIKSYYRNSKGIILTFDVSDLKTFLDIESWLIEIRANCRDEDLVIALVANKIDLAHKRSVTSERAKALADRFNLIYFETCARTGENVAEMLERLVSKITSIIELSNESNHHSISKSVIDLKDNYVTNPPVESKKFCNC
jgi:small GTP-binding protein